MSVRRAQRWIVVVVLIAHGLIHLMGAAKGFGWAKVTQLQEPISNAMGAAWLVAALLVIGTAVLLGARVRRFWMVGAVAVVASQSVILSSWNDAKAGTVANVVLLGAVVYGFAAYGPSSFRAEYRRDVASVVVASTVVASRDGCVVTEADLALLPAAVARYVRRAGAMDQPRIHNFRARVHGRIRGGVDKPWMPFVGEQVNTFGTAPSRVFFMDATMFGLPVDVLHAFIGPSATMRVKACSIVPMVRAAGPEMDRAETVTLFNDLCILAPAALVDAPITWQLIEKNRVRGTFTNASQTVSADLVFNETGDLVNFVSDDRLRSSADGKTFTRQRWSTPTDSYRDLGLRRVATMGSARWHAPEPEGEFTYIEVVVDSIEYNTGVAPAVPSSTALAA